MRWLGMAAAFGVLLAAVLNIIWFSRHMSGFGVFLSVAWPAVVGTVAFMGFTILLGFITVRLMLRRDGEEPAPETSEKEDGGPRPTERRAATEPKGAADGSAHGSFDT